jgi:hypothetical protein
MIVGLFILMLLPQGPAMSAIADQAEIMVAPGYPDTLRVVAGNYQAKVANDYDLISCIGPIEKRPDSGLIFLSADTALYYGLPSPETHGRATSMAAAKNHILVLRNLTEGFNASRMFDLSKFDVIILCAKEVGMGVSPADMLIELGSGVDDFDMQYDMVPNKVLLLTAPNGDAEISATVSEGLYKTIIKFEQASLVIAMYWLEDASFAVKAYNQKTNGKILALTDDDDWDIMMANDKFAADINADLISAIVMPAQAPDSMIKDAGKAGAQRIVLYSYTGDDIASAPAGDPVSLVRVIDGLPVYNCLHPDITLFWYQT